MLKRKLLMLALCAWFMPAPAIAHSPTEQIQQIVEKIMNVVADSANTDEGRREQLREVLLPCFDWLEMSKQALGKHWSRASGREDEFMWAFADLLGHAYIAQIRSYKNEKILFVQESVENDRAQVQTKIVPEKGESTAVNYRLQRRGGEWKIYDVIVADISVVSNYRSQFNRILAKGSFDDLLAQLRQKELRQRN